MTNPEPIKHIEITLPIPEPAQHLIFDDTAAQQGNEWVNDRKERIDTILAKPWHEVTEEDRQWWIDEALVVDSGLLHHRELWASMCVSAHSELTKTLRETAQAMSTLEMLHRDDKLSLKETLIQVIRRFNKLTTQLISIETFKKG